MKKLAKEGWHPSFDDKFKIDRKNISKPREWVSLKKDDPAQKAASHQSAPLNSLRDPSEFAPPPKHVNYYGADAARASISSPASPATSGPSTAVVPVDTRRYDTDSGGLGGALSQDTASTWQQRAQQEQAQAEAPKPPPGPYRKDTTGLRTDHLPPPPVRRGTGVASPPSSATSRPQIAYKPSLPSPASSSPAKPKGPPSLPPRLPPRQSAEPNEYTPPPPPAYNEATSQPPTPAVAQPPQSFPAPSSNISTNASSLHRLAGAGISVPSLGVSRSAASPPPPQSSSPASRFNQGGGLSELQNRFNKLNTSNTSQATTMASPQDANTASSPMSAHNIGGAYNTFNKARQDPSKVSLSEAKQAATTANAVNQRYGAQIGQGISAANRFATKQGMGGQSGADAASNGYGESSGGGAGLAGLANVAQKKAPPPPPPSRSGAGAGQRDAGRSGGGAPPPPVPMGSKPRF
ncbi:hypothetical protein CAC42_7576 [Sphaceloma murrayae]|uniref:Uncharacterized protein n=1 Tax=Sphaceloma murrayae TaxID=2082308 RepID=A0A2K1QT04_9PEZI|nr:hypothetical protein CAC42_7576 [Sphaceloma murrayae]